MSTSLHLLRPYTRVFIDTEEGIVGHVLEFPGCTATGPTVGEAWNNLAMAAREWLKQAAARGEAIPPPFEEGEGVRALVRDALAWREYQRNIRNGQGN